MPFNFKKLLKRENFSGHLNYSPPELVLEKNVFSHKVDVWGFGCCIYYMLTNKDPFDGKVPHETKCNILNGYFYHNMKIKHFCKEKIQDYLISKIINNSLQQSDKNRLAMKDIIMMIDEYEKRQTQKNSSLNNS
jgi:serine/threonine protein kinase